jgi:hypothetical protein
MKEGKILVIDKIKDNNNILTILPWWKLEEWETSIDCLIREIKEEIWIDITWLDIWEFLWSIHWESPSSNIHSEVRLYRVNTKILVSDIILEDKLSNPRFLSWPEILRLDTTTDLTKQSIKKLLNFENKIFQNWENTFHYQYARTENEIIIIYNNQIYSVAIERIKLKKISYNKWEKTFACYLKNLEYLYGCWDDKTHAYSNFIGKLLSHIEEYWIQWSEFDEILL